MTTIQLGPTTFDGSATTGWVFQELVDWYSLTDDKVGITEKPQSHGAFGAGRSLRSAAVVSFTAVYLGETAAEVLDAGERMAAALAESSVEMIVTDDLRASSRTVSVRVAQMKDHLGRPNGEFTFDCVARDPRRYSVGDTWTSTGPATSGGGLVWPAVWPLVWQPGGADGRVALENRGSAPSSPVYRLRGGFTSATLTNVETAQRIGFTRPVPATSVVEIDTRTRQARIDGQSDVSRYLSIREWWDVAPYSTTRVQLDLTGADADAGLDAMVRSAWFA